MAKVITKDELQEIVNTLFDDQKGEYLATQDSFRDFMCGITEAVCSVCGGEIGHTDYIEEDGLGYTIGVHLNDSVPSDGGIWKEYDTDVSWEEGQEISK